MQHFDPAATVLMVGVEGQTLTSEEAEFLKKIQPSGVILFGRNINQSNHKQVLQLTTSIQEKNLEGKHTGGPLLVAIDQEGGRVARFKGSFPNQGAALELADRQIDGTSLNMIRSYGSQMGEHLLRLGINVNFAPVADLFTEPRNTAIGDRCFGETPHQVITRAGAFLAGLQQKGVVGCLKHFPGQGHAAFDTHLGSAVVDLPMNLLWDRELAPFRALIDQGVKGTVECVSMIMVAHCIYPAISPLEASRSPEVMDLLLRKKLGFNGVIVTDDMMMGAIPQTDRDWCQAIIDAVRAGADLVLVCKGLDRAQLAYDCLSREADQNHAFAHRLIDAASRVMNLRSSL